MSTRPFGHELTSGPWNLRIPPQIEGSFEPSRFSEPAHKEQFLWSRAPQP